MNQPYGVTPVPYPQSQPTDLAADKRARSSMYLGVASLLLACLAGIPAIVLGATALKQASPAAKKQALTGIGLGAFTSLGTMVILIVAALMPSKPTATTASSTGAPSSSMSAESVAAPVTSATEPTTESPALRPKTTLDAWAASAIDAADFKIGIDESWALYPAGTTDCATDLDGKPMRLDRPSTSDQFEARRQEERRVDIAKKHSGALVKLGHRNVSVEFGDFDFAKEQMRVTVVAEGPWPMGGQAPTFRRESDRVETKQKIGELGGKDLNVTREQELPRFENASTLVFTAKVSKDQAERWTKGERKVDVLMVQRFLGLGFHKVCQTTCARILGVNECSPDNVGFGEYNRAELIGYRIAIDDVVVGEKQPASPPPG